MAATGSVISDVDLDQSVIWGEDRQIYIDCVNQAGARLNMSGYSLTWILENTDGTVGITKVTPTAINIVSSLADATLDRAIVDIDAADWATVLTRGRLSHYLRRVTAGSNHVLSRGEFHLLDI